jgi:hypothetical protein
MVEVKEPEQKVPEIVRKEKPEDQIRFVFFDNQVVLNDRTIH